MDNTVIQKVDDLILCIDRGFTKKKYFLLCDSRQVYIKLEEGHYRILDKLLPFLDGNYKISQIKQNLGSEGMDEGILDKAIEFLKKKGLLVGEEVQITTKVEIELTSRKVFEVSLQKYFEKHTLMYKIICGILFVLTLAVVIYGMLFGIFTWDIFMDSLQGADSFVWNSAALAEAVIVITCFILSTVIHEVGHIVTSIAMGIRPKSFTLQLKMGIIPVFYIRYVNYYSLSSLRKIMISLGGIWMNLLQMLLCWILLHYYNSWVLAALLVYNVGMCLSCFTLFGTSDGYFVIATLLNLEGVRWRMLKVVSGILYRKEPAKYYLKDIKNYLYVIYFILSYGLTFISLYTIGIMIVRFLNVCFISPAFITAAVFIIIALNVADTLKKFIISLKKIAFT